MGDKKNIWSLGFVSFINDMSSKIILPLLPLFIKDIGGTGIAIGLISGLGESIASLFKMLAGYWSDKLGKRKIFVFSGYLTSAISKFLLYAANTWPLVLILRSTERLGKGLRSAPRDAILAASTKKDSRGKSFGIHRAMDSGGAIIGAIIAFILYWYFEFSFSRIFLIAGVIAFFSLVPLLFVKETGTKKRSMELKLGLKALPTSLKVFILIATIFALGNFSYMFFVLKSQEYFTDKLAVGIPIFLYILYNTSYTLFAVPVGTLSDRIGRKKVLFLGYSLFGLVSLGFIFAQSLIMLVILFLLYGLNYAFVNATERAYVSDMADSKYRGTALGTFHMSTSLAALPAGLISGFLWNLNNSYTFIYGTVLALLTSALFVTFSKD